jgi:glycosyltransferase involved in cell wall biosynthesis
MRGRGTRELGSREEVGTKSWEVNVEALRETLHRLLTDHDLRERFRAKTAQVKQELSWEEPIAQMEELYASLTRGK